MTDSPKPSSTDSAKRDSVAAVSGLQVLDRLMAIFVAFEAAKDSNHELSLAEVCQRVDLDKATIHRMLAAAAAHGLVEQDKDTRKYHMGFRFFELGMLTPISFGIGKIAHESLEQLSHATGETVNLAVLNHGRVLCVDKVESDRPFRFPSEVGLSLPAHATSAGKVLLSSLNDKELARLVEQAGLPSYTPQTITKLDDLKIELDMVRRRGYALDDEELELGLRCVSAPCYDHAGKLVASLSVPAPAARFSKSEIPQRVAMLKDAASRISARLGFRRNAGDAASGAEVDSMQAKESVKTS